MKKFVLLLLIAILALQGIMATGTAEAESEDIVLQWWDWNPSMKDRNEALIAEFEASHPGVTVELSTYATSEYWTKLRIQANQRKLPDVFTMSSGYLEEWANAGLLLDLGDMIKKDNLFGDFYQGIFDVGKSISGTDSYYAIPFALVTTVLYYNKDHFDAAGLSYPDDSWTWDDFTSAAKKLTIDKDGDGKPDQWGHWFYGRYAQIESWVYANNGKLLDANKRFAPDANAMAALKMLTDLVLVDGSAPTQKEMSALRQQDIFPQQLASMWVDGSWNIDNNRIVAGDSFNWGIARIPQGPAASSKIGYGWPDYYAISPDTKSAGAAWEFAKFIAGEGLSMGDYMAGKIPSYKALAESDDFSDMSQQPGDMGLLIKQADGELRTSFTLGWSEWRGYAAAETLGLNGLIDAIINGEESFDKGMSEGAEGINAVLGRYYK